MKVVLFVGSVRPGRMAERVAKMVRNYISQWGDIEVITFDPLEKSHLTEVREPVHFSSNPSENLLTDQETIENADGFIVVCSEYNRSIPPVCSAMMCNFPPKSYAAKPVVFVNYSLGQYGGVSATMNLRQFCTELSMIPLQASINLPLVNKTVSEDGHLEDATYERQMERAFSQLLWYARVMRKARIEGDDPFPA
ncbi:uncharacterized protein LOC100903418 [Galendromus occidentalis]|uniref:Uncharacterized protein LOC100903418 n=1 Tax=Galendromus occidentalis TaxID=34638 RepID=A0AAJ6VXP2_9ACAR|nr:uncharacterized protein LOC100903418 [Galendromus occidentalis]